jgi:hypothetical protein
MIWVLPDQAAKADALAPGAGSPDTSFFYQPEEIIEMAEAYGEEGRQAYIRARWTFDLIFPFVYGGFLVTVISWFVVSAFALDHRLVGLNLVPVLGVIFDLLENSAASIIMAVYPARLGWLAVLSAALSGTKWVFVNGSFVVLLFVAALWLIRLIKRPTTAV